MLLCKKKKRTTDTYYNMRGSLKHYDEQKKQDTKESIEYDSIHVKL